MTWTKFNMSLGFILLAVLRTYAEKMTLYMTGVGEELLFHV